MKPATHRDKGEQAEQLACHYLQARGLRLTQRNYHCRLGEIDLIMEDRESLVFIEVRYRRKGRFGDAIDSITPAKQARLIAAAQHYLQRTGGAQNKPCRFDVVGITSEKGADNIMWLRDAFRVES
ncbi:Protein of unknown function UPF0102 [Nitrosococcus oceani ATCC 19707]|uniref:UPF0102 protein Noc_0355 n=2 Tax=Nitrosococcus oceani TaxID=1229 RepID=Y355_NITOC|nr:YraN family protein [Nitrosococcus oceani]Q3JE65.1 RecName: Full=UPF0102 protein Noc_0355 [Nitrosococcus oceani ATCC 19707]KFI20664.1 hypothetical protein IB75_01810 [Nitrosococcus oceani C-27]ABA56881.1 Protein of unknown function UPF0102 [Nitrosococcus oceani ATCC 19707]EDZ66588.1 conserved hypothetical protein TIGR00252 [Nitrosococcus oceani AFC27]GEM21464.1 YraN family protein [Nitrosococcus oceani]